MNPTVEARVAVAYVSSTPEQWNALPKWERIALNTLFWGQHPVSVNHPKYV